MEDSKIAFDCALYNEVARKEFVKNVLQFWLCYIRKMVQSHVLDTQLD